MKRLLFLLICFTSFSGSAQRYLKYGEEINLNADQFRGDIYWQQRLLNESEWTTVCLQNPCNLVAEDDSEYRAMVVSEGCDTTYSAKMRVYVQNLFSNNAYARPLEITSIRVLGFSGDTISAQIGDRKVLLLHDTLDNYLFLMPVISPGVQYLKLDSDSVLFDIGPANVIEDPEFFVSESFSTLESSFSNLGNADSIFTLINEIRAGFNSLTNEEKAAVAMFIQSNQLIDTAQSENLANSGGRVTTDNEGCQNLKLDRNYFRRFVLEKQKDVLILGGLVLAAHFTPPTDPLSGVIKGLAVVAALRLIVKMREDWLEKMECQLIGATFPYTDLFNSASPTNGRRATSKNQFYNNQFSVINLPEITYHSLENQLYGVPALDDFNLFFLKINEAWKNFSVFLGEPPAYPERHQTTAVPPLEYLSLVSENSSVEGEMLKEGSTLKLVFSSENLDPDPMPFSFHFVYNDGVLPSFSSESFEAILTSNKIRIDTVLNNDQTTYPGSLLPTVEVWFVNPDGTPATDLGVNWIFPNDSITGFALTENTGSDGKIVGTIGVGEVVGEFQVGLELFRAGENVAVFSDAIIFTSETTLGLAKTGGDEQTAFYDLELEEPFQVLFRDAEGRPVKNGIIYWKVREGDGNLISETTATNEEGSSENRFVYGESNSAKIEVYGYNRTLDLYSDTVYFTCQAGVKFELVSGDNQVGYPFDYLNDTIVIKVTDVDGTPFDLTRRSEASGLQVGTLSFLNDHGVYLSGKWDEEDRQVGVIKITAAITDHSNIDFTSDFVFMLYPPGGGIDYDTLTMKLDSIDNDFYMSFHERYVISDNIIEGDKTYSIFNYEGSESWSSTSLNAPFVAYRWTYYYAYLEDTISEIRIRAGDPTAERITSPSWDEYLGESRSAIFNGQSIKYGNYDLETITYPLGDSWDYTNEENLHHQKIIDSFIYSGFSNYSIARPSSPDNPTNGFVKITKITADIVEGEFEYHYFSNKSGSEYRNQQHITNGKFRVRRKY